MVEGISLAGKVALVTGAGSGIGKGAALAFARAGARVAFLDMKQPASPRAALPVAPAPDQAAWPKALADALADNGGRLWYLRRRNLAYRSELAGSTSACAPMVTSTGARASASMKASRSAG